MVGGIVGVCWGILHLPRVGMIHDPVLNCPFQNQSRPKSYRYFFFFRKQSHNQPPTNPWDNLFSSTRSCTPLCNNLREYSRLPNVATKRKEPHACTIGWNIDSNKPHASLSLYSSNAFVVIKAFQNHILYWINHMPNFLVIVLRWINQVCGTKQSVVSQ